MVKSVGAGEGVGVGEVGSMLPSVIRGKGREGCCHFRAVVTSGTLQCFPVIT